MRSPRGRRYGKASTLRLFCEHYQDVLDTPDGDSHANIRAFVGEDDFPFTLTAVAARAHIK